MRLLLCNYCGAPYRQQIDREDTGREDTGREESSASETATTASLTSGRDAHCCYGCYVADRVFCGGESQSGDGLARGLQTRLMLGIFLGMAVMVFSLVLYADVYWKRPGESGGAHPLGPLAPLFAWLILAFATPAMVLLGVPLARNVLRTESGTAGSRSVDLLIVIGSLSAWLLSVRNTVQGQGALYFDTAVLVLVFVTLGRTLEARIRARATRSLQDLLRVDPLRARVLRRGEGGDSTTLQVDAEALRPGDRLRVCEGDRVAADGDVVAGTASLDVSTLTGESKPASVVTGDRVHAGSTVLEGDLDVLVTEACGDRVIDRVVRAVSDALCHRMPLERTAERLVRILLPLSIAVACAVTLFVGLRLGFGAGLERGLAVLLVSCPCALGIATPLATWVAVGRMSQRGVLIRGPEVFEALARPLRIFLDKTGTLTQQSLEVVGFRRQDGRSERDTLVCAASVAAHSSHPVARAVEHFARARATELRAEPVRIETVSSEPGRGLRSRAQDREVLLGSRAFLSESGVVLPEDDEVDSATRSSEVHFAADGHWHGAFEVRERLRPGAERFVQELRARGLAPVLLTGDEERAASQLAGRLGIEARAGLLPQEKLEVVRSSQSRRQATVMVGDGVNDGPVLAAADVGIALSDGAELARDAAAVVLLRDREGAADGQVRLPAILDLLDTAKRTTRRVRFNLFWAFSYNAIGMWLAARGSLHPLVACLLMVLSSLFVVGGTLHEEDAIRRGEAP